MAHEPSPDPSDRQAELAKRYRPSVMLFAVVYLLTLGLYWLISGPMPADQTRASLVAYSALSSAGATAFMTVYLRILRKVGWLRALAYCATIFGAMFCADLARIYLLYR